MREYRASKTIKTQARSGTPAPWEVDRLEMEVTCWCEEQIVWVTRSEVKAGRTRACKLPKCQRMGA